MNTLKVNSYDRSALAWKAVKVRNLQHPEDAALVRAVTEGKVVLDPAEVAAEVEAYIKTLRPLHPECAGWVRRYGYAMYHYRNTPDTLGEGLCQGCAKPLACPNPDGKHSYQELSSAECRVRGIYHAGNCYHVELCTGCGHVFAYDSSG